MKQIWIPSKVRIREELVRDLSAKLRATSYKSATFLTFLNANAGILAWIGEGQCRQLIQDVVKQCELEASEYLDYEREIGP